MQGGVVESQETWTLDPPNERKHPWNSDAWGITVGEPFSTPNWWIKWEIDDNGNRKCDIWSSTKNGIKSMKMGAIWKIKSCLMDNVTENWHENARIQNSVSYNMIWNM